MTTDLYVGAMSGTSMDGVDAVLVDLTGGRFRRVTAHHHTDFPRQLRTRLTRVALQSQAVTLTEWVELDLGVADSFAWCIQQLVACAGLGVDRIRAVGSHGQTVFHNPHQPMASSVQLGDPNRIATVCGLTVVADFRRRDLAEGGQGAPLVPAFHHAVFASPTERRCVANIGGIANITVLPGIRENQVRGYDTGPGNALMDEWSAHHLAADYDAGGRWARSGTLHPGLLDALLNDPFFRASSPKTTGRDYFNLSWVRSRFPGLDRLHPADAQRTFCELTALTVTAAAHGEGAQRLLICGGGGDNLFLVERLRETFKSGAVELTDAHHFPHMQVEAAAFAWLAMRTIAGRPGNLPSVTGARRPAVLGGIYQS